jgi:hypothetical protein
MRNPENNKDESSGQIFSSNAEKFGEDSMRRKTAMIEKEMTKAKI